MRHGVLAQPSAAPGNAGRMASTYRTAPLLRGGPRRCSEVDRATLTDYQFMTAAAPCPSAALFEGGPLRTDATAVSGGYCGKTADALRTALIHNAICCGKTADALLRTQHA